MAKRNTHPSVIPSDSEVVGEPEVTEPTLHRDLSGWRKRFFDDQGNPLPVDGIRVDVTTGERLGRLK